MHFCAGIGGLDRFFANGTFAGSSELAVVILTIKEPTIRLLFKDLTVIDEYFMINGKICIDT